jgi:hypothetical protein
MTMAYAANSTLAGLYPGLQRTSAATARSTASRSGESILARIGAALMESRQRAADREIARHRYLVDQTRGIELTASRLPFTRD